MVGSGQTLRINSALTVDKDTGGSDTLPQISFLTASTRKSNMPPSCVNFLQAVTTMTQKRTGPELYMASGSLMRTTGKYGWKCSKYWSKYRSMSSPEKTLDLSALGCEGRPLAEDGVVRGPGVKAGTEDASGKLRGGGALLKDGMDDNGDTPVEKPVEVYRRGWSDLGLGRCAGGIGGSGSCPCGVEDDGWGATACLMLWTSWTSSSNLL